MARWYAWIHGLSASRTAGCSSNRCRNAGGSQLRWERRRRASALRRDFSVSYCYTIELELRPDEFIDVLRRSTLAERRPVDDRATIIGMLANADIIIAARNESGQLVGVSRAITDYHYCTYLSDLAV